ncbi:MAG: efflux RND transporter periplasmic adaptor subunit [Bryobacteraceae bacterium]
MDAELKSLRIDRSKRRDEPSGWAKWWIIGGVLLFIALGAGRFAYERLNAATEVDIVRVRASETGGSGVAAGEVILNATGYIVAAHKIQLASKVVGKVAWIGVDKSDKVKKGQVLVRLEDDDYKAQVQQARGAVQSLDAKLAELVAGSRPEEIQRAKADAAQAQADLQNAKVTLDRTAGLVKEGVLSKQALDDANARYNAAQARFRSVQSTYELAVIGTRKEQIDQVRGQIVQAKGTLAYGETQLENTVIRAPISGTILERNVERGEFVTTGFVGDKGAKGYVVSMADLNDLQVELDINQGDFAKLGPKQRGVVTTDAFPDRAYDGVIDEVSPEANRQKATVQVKVKILKPDDYLRPEMNASVKFLSDAKPVTSSASPKPLIVIPAAAVKGGKVFVVVDGKAVQKAVRTGSTVASGVRIEEGLLPGEDIVADPPDSLKDGDRVKARKS